MADAVAGRLAAKRQNMTTQEQQWQKSRCEKISTLESGVCIPQPAMARESLRARSHAPDIFSACAVRSSGRRFGSFSVTIAGTLYVIYQIVNIVRFQVYIFIDYLGQVHKVLLPIIPGIFSFMRLFDGLG